MDRTFSILICLGMLLVMIPLGMDGEPRVVESRGGSELIVGPGVGNYSTIQAAVDSAEDGDNVIITDGIYNESVHIDVGITILGNGRNTVLVGEETVLYISAHNVVVYGLTILSYTKADIGISIGYHDNVRVSDCQISGFGTGIWVGKSNGTYINHNSISAYHYGIFTWEASNCTFLMNAISGNRSIEMESCHDNIIEYNQFRVTGHGIFLHGGTVRTTIRSNGFTNCSVGLLAISDYDLVENLSIAENVFWYNSIGISCENVSGVSLVKDYFKANSRAMSIVGSDDISITKGILEYNDEGITILDSSNGSVNLTLFRENKGYGIFLHGTKWFRVHHNDFLDNHAPNHTQAFGGSTLDMWDDGSGMGNHWNDWTSPDVDSDGIVDNLYFVDRDIKHPPIVSDRYPSVVPITDMGNNTSPSINVSNVMICHEDQEYWVDYNAVDDDPLSWRLDTDADFLSINSSSGILSGTPDNGDVGTYHVKVTVTDGTYSDHTLFNLTVKNVNDPPEWGSDPSHPLVYDPVLKRYVRTKIDLHCQEDERFSFHFEAFDPDPTLDNLVWTKVSGPSFLNITQNNSHPHSGTQSKMVLSGTPDNSDVGTHSVRIKVSDGNGGDLQTTFNLTVNNTNDPPTITTSDILTGVVNSTYSVDYDATDVDPTHDNLTWTLTTNATFLTISSSSGLLSGTPTAPGVYGVHIGVGDGKGGHDHRNFTLTVSGGGHSPGNSKPGLSSTIPDVEMEEDGNAITIELRTLVSDPDGDDLIFEVFTGYNVIAFLDGKDRLIIKPREDWAGSEDVVVRVSDGKDTFTFTIPVTVLNTNDPPEIGSVEIPFTLKAGELLIFKATVNDPDLDYGDGLTYVWSIIGRGEVGTGELLSIRLKEGDHTLVLRVTDLYGEMAESRYDITVEPSGSNEERPTIPIVPIAGIGIVLMLLIIAAVSFFVFRRRETDHDEFVIDEGEARTVKTGSVRGSLWDNLDMGSDLEITSLYTEVLSGRSGDRSRTGHLRRRIMMEYDDDRIGPDVYEDLIGVLDEIEE